MTEFGQLAPDSGRLCGLVVCSVLWILVSVPLVGYYGHLMATGYTEFEYTPCRFDGVFPINVSTQCNASIVQWRCYGESDLVGNVTYPYLRAEYVYHDANVTIVYHPTCDTTCCAGQYTAGVNYSCVGIGTLSNASDITALKCAPPSLPDRVYLLCVAGGIVLVLSVCTLTCIVASSIHDERQARRRRRLLIV